MKLKKYLLKDGSIYWHRFYYALVPDILTHYSPPGGSYNYAYYLYQPWKYVRALYDQVKWFIQRGVYGYSDADVWGWHYHMAEINARALRTLAKRTMGYPMGMTMAGWRSRLLKMADGFQTILDDVADVTSYRRLSRREYKALCRSRQCCIARGLRLYVKHFHGLWD